MARTRTSPLDVIAAELYGLPRDEFTAARNARAKAEKAAGRTELAASVERLGKPTTAAALVNLIAREEPELVDELADVGSALRDAHSKLDGATLRTLSQRRAKAVAALIAQARVAAGKAIGDTVLRELEDIFAAALAHPHVAGAVVAGRVAAGKDFGDRSSWPLLADVNALPTPSAKAAKPDRKREAEDTRQARLLAQAKEELAQGRDALDAAETALREAASAAEDTQGALERAETEVRELRAELAEAEQAEQEAHRAARSARRDEESAQRKVDRLGTKVEELTDRLAELE